MINDENASSADPTSLLDDNMIDDDCAEAIVTVLENIPDRGFLPMPPHDPEAPEPPANGMITTTRKVATALFEIISRGPFKSFRFRADRPEEVAKYITEAEWEELRNRFDDLGQKTKWNDSALLLLLVTIVAFFFFIGAVTDGEISPLVGIPALAALCAGPIYFTMQALTQKRKKDAAMDQIRLACQEYSETFKKRWIHLEFYESDPADKFSYHAQLTFHKTICLMEPKRIPFMMDDRYYDDQD
jgi:hypothetical protein